MKSIFRSLIISVVAILVTVGVANAVGVFYYDSVNDSFVIDGDLAVSGGGTLSGFFREINSAGNEHLYINSQEKINIQLTSGSRFGVNNSVNSRVFQVDNDGLLKLGTNLDNGRQSEPAVVNFSADGKTGNIEVRGTTTLVGGVDATGVDIWPLSGWLESLRLVDTKTNFITWPGNLAFGAASSPSTGFYWADTSAGPNGATSYPMTLTPGGALLVKSKITSPRYILDGVPITDWIQVLSGTYATETSLRLSIQTLSAGQFGGMFAFGTGGGTVGVTCGTGTIGNPLVTDGATQLKCECPKGFTAQQLSSNTVYYPTVFFCYKINTP